MYEVHAVSKTFTAAMPDGVLYRTESVYDLTHAAVAWRDKKYIATRISQLEAEGRRSERLRLLNVPELERLQKSEGFWEPMFWFSSSEEAENYLNFARVSHPEWRAQVVTVS